MCPSRRRDSYDPRFGDGVDVLDAEAIQKVEDDGHLNPAVHAVEDCGERASHDSNDKDFRLGAISPSADLAYTGEQVTCGVPLSLVEQSPRRQAASFALPTIQRHTAGCSSAW